MVKLRIQTQSLISTVQMRTTSFYTLIIVVVLILLHFFFFFLDLSRLCFLIHHFTSLKSYKVVTKGWSSKTFMIRRWQGPKIAHNLTLNLKKRRRRELWIHVSCFKIKYESFKCQVCSLVLVIFMKQSSSFPFFNNCSLFIMWILHNFNKPLYSLTTAVSKHLPLIHDDFIQLLL